MLPLRRVVLMLVPTTIVGLIYFWYKKSYQKGLTDVDDIDSEFEEITSDVSTEMSLQDLTELSEKDTIDSEKPQKIVVEDEIVPDEEIVVEESVLEDFFMKYTEANQPEIENSENKYHRVRNQSSCDADSAFADDYSSDSISVAGSSDHTKSPEHALNGVLRVSDLESLMINDEKISNEFFDLDAINLMDLGQPHHWGSTEVTDTEENSITSMFHLDVMEQANSKLEKYNNNKSRESPRSERSRRKRLDSGRRSKKSPKKLPPSPQKSYPSPRSKSKNNTPQRNDSRKGFNKENNYRKELDESWRVPEVKEDKTPIVIEFDLPDPLCGRLIGKGGKHIQDVKKKNGVEICVEPERHGEFTVVSISGPLSCVERTEKLLNSKFDNKLKRIIYPDIEEAISNVKNVSLTLNTYTDVIVTGIKNVQNFFVQIFNEEVDKNITELQVDLADCYSAQRPKYLYSESEKPKFGDYCVACIDNMWCRLCVRQLMNNDQVMVDFLDYGGSIVVPYQVLQKIRPDFLELPLQAVECNMANISPLPFESEFSAAASDLFNEFVQGRVVQALIKSTKNQVPCVQLTYEDTESKEVICINKELSDHGVIRWNDS